MSNSLHWLLQESLICGLRMEVYGGVGPGVLEMLHHWNMTAETGGGDCRTVPFQRWNHRFLDGVMVCQASEALPGPSWRKVVGQGEKPPLYILRGQNQPEPTDFFPGLILASMSKVDLCSPACTHRKWFYSIWTRKPFTTPAQKF